MLEIDGKSKFLQEIEAGKSFLGKDNELLRKDNENLKNELKNNLELSRSFESVLEISARTKIQFDTLTQANTALENKILGLEKLDSSNQRLESLVSSLQHELLELQRENFEKTNLVANLTREISTGPLGLASGRGQQQISVSGRESYWKRLMDHGNFFGTQLQKFSESNQQKIGFQEFKTTNYDLKQILEYLDNYSKKVIGITEV